MSRGSKSCPGLGHVRNRVLPIKAWLGFVHDKAKVSKKIEIVIHRERNIFILIEFDIKKRFHEKHFCFAVRTRLELATPSVTG